MGLSEEDLEHSVTALAKTPSHVCDTRSIALCFAHWRSPTTSSADGRHHLGVGGQEDLTSYPYLVPLYAAHPLCVHPS